jgi:formamidopyrimidine-DNA glycosylase
MERDDFLQAMSRRRGMIKPVLLDQSLLAGLGNLYADEALFQSGICPQARCLDR